MARAPSTSLRWNGSIRSTPSSRARSWPWGAPRTQNRAEMSSAASPGSRAMARKRSSPSCGSTSSSAPVSEAAIVVGASATPKRLGVTTNSASRVTGAAGSRVARPRTGKSRRSNGGMVGKPPGLRSGPGGAPSAIPSCPSGSRRQKAKPELFVLLNPSRSPSLVSPGLAGTGDDCPMGTFEDPQPET